MQSLLQEPQAVAVDERSVSQPLDATPSQSEKVPLQVPTLQLPALHVYEATFSQLAPTQSLGVEQHGKEEDSQPLVALKSQSK